MDREKKSSYDRSYYERTRERHLAQGRAWRQANPDKVRQYSRAHRERNPEYQAERQRKARYGLSREMYQEKLSNQEGLCAICRCLLEAPVVDHCHDTGKVRGLLCQQCNALLGMAKESTANLQNAIAYLQYHGEGWD